MKTVFDIIILILMVLVSGLFVGIFLKRMKIKYFAYSFFYMMSLVLVSFFIPLVFSMVLLDFDMIFVIFVILGLGFFAWTLLSFRLGKIIEFGSIGVADVYYKPDRKFYINFCFWLLFCLFLFCLPVIKILFYG